jgi:hypothetical protein
MKVGVFQFCRRSRSLAECLGAVDQIARFTNENGGDVLLLPADCFAPDPLASALEHLPTIARAARVGIMVAGATDVAEESRIATVLISRRGALDIRRTGRSYRHRSLHVIPAGDSRVALLVARGTPDAAHINRLLNQDANVIALALLARATDDPASLATTVRGIAANNCVAVTLCNAASPCGSGGSMSVLPDGTIHQAPLDGGERLFITELVPPIGDPLEGLPSTVTLEALGEDRVSQNRFVAAKLISRSMRLEGPGTPAAKKQARTAIRRLWKQTNLGALWARLNASDRERLVAGAAEDAASFARLYHAQDYGMPLIDDSLAWHERKAIVDIVDAMNAIKRRALQDELRLALRLGATIDDLRSELGEDLIELRDDPSSLFVLTQVYLQGMARNALRTQVRELCRQRRAYSTTDVTLATPHADVIASPSCSDLVFIDVLQPLTASLSADELVALELLVEEGLSESELAGRAGWPDDRATAALRGLREKIDLLTDRISESGK